MSIKVAVNGALGKMGQEVVKAINAENDLELVGVIDIKDIPNQFDERVVTGSDLEFVLKESKAEVVVDFTQPDTIMKNIEVAVVNGVRPVVGTTGLTDEDLDRIHFLAEKYDVGVIVAPNFSIGAILMMHCAMKVSQYIPNMEIIEMHHDQKLDAPSGTAIKTTQLMKRDKKVSQSGNPAYGSIYNGINVHSVRLPGFIAHQEVIFGNKGEILTIRHDSTSRESFMPGVIMAVREICNVKGVIYGLEKMLKL